MVIYPSTWRTAAKVRTTEWRAAPGQGRRKGRWSFSTGPPNDADGSDVQRRQPPKEAARRQHRREHDGTWRLPNDITVGSLLVDV